MCCALGLSTRQRAEDQQGAITVTQREAVSPALHSASTLNITRKRYGPQQLSLNVREHWHGLVCVHALDITLIEIFQKGRAAGGKNYLTA